MDLLKGLNPAQRKAVEASKGPLLILAGAGSGKTRVLTHRIAYLIKERDVAPYRILAVTFTNRAAGEMKKRIEVILGMDIKNFWLGTFHSISLRILRRELPMVGKEGDFVIYDTADQLSLIKDCLKELNFADSTFHPKGVLSTISQVKGNAVTPEEFREGCSDFYSERVSMVYGLYQEKLKRSNAFDFDDLIFETIKLLQGHPIILNRYQELFYEILVDEFQDTNRGQYLLLRLFTSKRDNLWVVGDDDQSIYSWRGAEIRNILDLEKDYPDLNILRLEQNYRSTKRIIEAANSVVEKNSDRLGKVLWTENPEGEKVIYRSAVNEHHEAIQTGRTIIDLVRDNDMRFRDIVVFYRTNAQSRVVEEEFMKLGIPYSIIGGVKFYERREIKDLLAYLRVIANPDDHVSLRRIINTPSRGIGDATLGAIAILSTERRISFYEAVKLSIKEGILSKGIESKVRNFVALIERFKDCSSKMGLGELVKTVLDLSGYIRMWEKDMKEGMTRIENIQEFVSAVREFEESEGESGDLNGFIDMVSLVTGIDLYEDKYDVVSMMTIHSAKGLEFPVVFIIGMEDGLFPISRALTMGDIEEERRLFYVGMTRAKEKVFLSGAESRKVFGITTPRRRSRFIDDIDPLHLYDETCISTCYAGERGHIFDVSINKKQAQGSLDVGQRVKHPIFGIGMIKRKEGEKKFTVLFHDAGLKKLLLPYATLERVE